MKTNKLFAVAAMLPVLFSCAKEEIRTNDNLSGDGQKYDFTITVSGDKDSITKASLSDVDGIFWVGGGKAGIVNDNANKESKVLDEAHIIKPGQGVYSQATFQFEGVDEGSYKLYYPYREGSVLDNIHFCVDLYQTTNVGKSADCFALVSDDMVSLKAGDQGIPATTTYKVVGSYIRFLVYGKENEQVKSIAIKCENNSRIAGEYYVDGTNNSLKGVYYNGEDIILDLQGASCPTTLGKDDSQGLYAAILPSSTDYPKAKNTYVVTTDGGFYTFKSESEKKFAFGSIKTLPLNLTKATKFSKTPEHLYIVGGATEIGWSCENAIELTKVDGKNQFEIKNIKLNAGSGDSGFKFLTTKGSWSKVYVNGFNNNKTITYYEDPVRANNDTKFSVGKDGYYNLTVDFDKNELTAEYITCPVVSHFNYTETTEMIPTGEPGVFKAAAVKVGGSSGWHDFKIKHGNNYYKPSDNQYKQINNFGRELDYTYTCDVVSSEIGSTKDADLLGWWIDESTYNTYTQRYYEITLDTINNKLTVRFAQGKEYWLNGNSFVWGEKKDEFKATVINETGVAKWVDLDVQADCYFRICGTYTYPYEGQFYYGEWYYAMQDYAVTLTPGMSAEVRPYCKDYNNSNFIISEAGIYDIEFDTKNLKLTVTKKK